MASTPALGFAFPANEFVDLAITYKDSFHTPLAGRNLVWQLVEGEATLRHQTTPVGSDGNGVNSIQVELADPNANSTVRLAVWPEDEADSKLEFECLFGAPKAAPPIGSGNWLEIVYPRDDLKDLAPINLDPSAGDINYLVFYADPYGIPIEGKEIILTSVLGPNTINNNTTIRAGQFYTHFKEVEEYSPGKWITTDKVDGKEAHSNNLLNDENILRNQVLNFWPINNSVLYPGYAYDLKTLHTVGNGFTVPHREIFWSVNTKLPDGIEVQIEPASLKEDKFGTAISSITVPYVVYGMDDKITLKVGLVGLDESEATVFDYPTFTIGGPRFSIIIPTPDHGVIDPYQTCQFQVMVLDEQGMAPSNAFTVTWDAVLHGEGTARFSVVISEVDHGLSQNNLYFSNMPQGIVHNVDVTITPTEGAPYQATYQVAANIIAQVPPATTDPLAVGIEQVVTVSLTDYKGNAVPRRTLYIARNTDIRVGSSAVTGADGIATIPVTSSTALTTHLSISEGPDCVPTIIELTFGETKRNIVTINKPEVDIRYDTQVAITANYTNDQGKPIQDAQLKLDFTLADGSPLPPNLTWMRSSATGPKGEYSFWFNYSTTDGLPASPVSIIATVRDDFGASDSVTLKFIGGGKENHLTLLHPANNSSQVPGTEIHVKLQLTNNNRQPMAKYPITWLVPKGITVESKDSLTAANGEATAIFTTTSKEMFEIDVVASAANASRYFRLNFTGSDYYDSNMFCKTNYAHNMPEGFDAVPRDEGEIVVFNFIYKKNDEPQPEQWIAWNIEPMSGNLRFYDENNVKWEANADHNVFTKTNAEGRAILKIGSSAAHLGHVIANPVGNPSATTPAVDFAIATFSADLAEPGMSRVNYEPKPIELSGQYSIDHKGFTLNIPENSAQRGYDLVVFWLESHMSDPTPSERIIITDIIEAENGVIVPFNYVTPKAGTTNTNMFCYMAVDSRTGQGFRSTPLPPEVKGTPLTNLPIPDQDRPMLAPRLYDNATMVVHGDIIGGLNVIVDYDPQYWIPQKTIHLIVYLNKHDGSFGANLTQEIPITDVEINAKKMVFNFPYDQVNGYDHGTLEADYFIEKTWSAVLDNVLLNTVDPFV